MSTSSYTAIVITADEPFGLMSHTQILYAQFLAKSNQVVYVQPPRAWQLKNLFGFGFSPNRVEQGVKVIAYRNYLPHVLDHFLGWNDRATERCISTSIEKKADQNLLIWHFDSYRGLLNSGVLSRRFVLQRLYHVIDPFYKNPIDRKLCQLCDLLIVTSPRNNNHYSEFAAKLINIPQALDLEATQKQLSGESSLGTFPHYFVLLGTLSNDIDFDWLRRLTDDLEVPLFLIGKKLPLKDESVFSSLCKRKNCHYLGLMQPEEFYPILKGASAGLINYNE